MQAEETTIFSIANISDLIEKVNQETADVLYISDKIHLPKDAEVKSFYWTDFTLIPQKNIKKTCKDNVSLSLPEDIKSYDFFVYNERKNLLLPFKKNDYLMDKDGYTTFNGKNYFYYDSDGNELKKF